MKNLTKLFGTRSCVLCVATIAAVAVFTAACSTFPAINPNTGPRLSVDIPELFSPDPDIVDDVMTIGITVNHSAPIKDWHIEVLPIRMGGPSAGQVPGGERGETRQGGERPEGERPEGERTGQGRRRGVFFEESGDGRPPRQWQWNGIGSSGNMVQSVSDYQFRLTVSDTFDNSSEYEGIISVGIIVTREGDNYRMVVPSIIFPPNASDFALLSAEDRRANARVFGLITRALSRFEDYSITVEGHANPTTPPNTTQRTNEESSALRPLSEQRARAVVDYLVNESGIDRSRLTAIGIGGIRTVAEWNDSEENWRNRRVEFLLQR